MRARGAALKLRRAPIFVSARAAPPGKAAVAKNHLAKPQIGLYPLLMRIISERGKKVLDEEAPAAYEALVTASVRVD